MELWDLYNRSGVMLKTDHVRGELLPQGAYHKIINIIVQHTDGDYLVMKRSEDKASCAGEYELSAGGSTIKGEDFEEGARRELREETGIQADVLYEISPVTVLEEKHYLQRDYYCITDIKKDAIQLQEGETQGYQWMSEAQVLEIAHKDSLVRLSAEVIDKINDIKQNR